MILFNEQYITQLNGFYFASHFKQQVGKIRRMKTTASKKIADENREVFIFIGKTLKKRRISADKSQETLAFDSEIGRGHISQIERGIANPSLKTIGALCFALGISFSEFFQPIDASIIPDGSNRKPDPSAKPKRTRLR